MKDYLALAEFTFPVLEYARKHDIRLRIRTDFEALEYELAMLEAENRLGGRGTLTEQFNPGVVTLTETTGHFIEARSPEGELIGLVAQRLDDLGSENLEGFIRRFWQRAFEAEDGAPIEFAPNQDPELRCLTGKLAYQGELWTRPERRASSGGATARLAEGLVKLGMATAWQMWEFDYIYAIVRKREYIRGLPMIWGYRSFIRLGFNWHTKPENVRPDNAIGYSSRDQFKSLLEAGHNAQPEIPVQVPMLISEARGRTQSFE